MLIHAESPESVLPEELDVYLANGWFRMAQTIFTTQFLCFQNKLYNAIWLRVDLNQWSSDSAQQKILKRNSRFSVEVRKATYSDQHSQLFQTYKKGVTFDGSSSLHQLLFGQSSKSIYNTREVNVYDGGSLIACGIFDIGGESAAGISCFYNHDYKKFSLGKFLIYSKMHFCKALGIRYFYPGYFVPGYKSFDYKLEIGKAALHFWDLPAQAWKPITYLTSTIAPLEEMTHHLEIIKLLLQKEGRECNLLRYEFFDANLVPHLQDSNLFDYPIFLHAFDLNEDAIFPIIIYNIFEKNYQLLQMRSVWVSNSPINNTEVYNSHVLKADKIIFSTPSATEMVMLFKMVNLTT
jgi:arginine-tRNA-protein transferase